MPRAVSTQLQVANGQCASLASTPSPPHTSLSGQAWGCLEAPAASELKHLPQPAALLSLGRASAFSPLSAWHSSTIMTARTNRRSVGAPRLLGAMGTARAMPASPRPEQVPPLTAGRAGAVHRGHPQVGGAGVEEHEELLGRRADGDGTDVLGLP